MQQTEELGVSQTATRKLTLIIFELSIIRRFFLAVLVLALYTTIAYCMRYVHNDIALDFMATVNFLPYALLGYLSLYPESERSGGDRWFRLPTVLGPLVALFFFFWTYVFLFVLNSGGLVCLLPRHGACLSFVGYLHFNSDVLIPWMGSSESWRQTWTSSLKSLSDFDFTSVFQLIQLVVYSVPIGLEWIARKAYAGPNLGYIVYGIHFVSFMIYGVVARAAVWKWSEAAIWCVDRAGKQIPCSQAPWCADREGRRIRCP